MEAEIKPAAWKTAGAFAILYLVWGSTFLAIRVGVREVPPFLLAAVRFTVAGLLLYGWMIARGERRPNRRQWGSLCVLALLIFVGDYGLLFWAERRVPSGVAAVMMATIPSFMALSEIALLKTQRLTLRLASALAIGLCGVAVLMNRSLHLGGDPVDPAGAGALILGAISWSVASALSKRMPLPASKALSSGAQMLAGGLMLALVSLGLGEGPGFHPSAVSGAAWAALAYLILAGSLIGFTAYVWLIHHESPTRVGTYAYVNPVVAVLLGYFAAGEPLGLRTVAGMLFVLTSVVFIAMAKKPASNSFPVKPP
jgi:drug/metabolite transporter (DMT)-like permease